MNRTRTIWKLVFAALLLAGVHALLSLNEVQTSRIAVRQSLVSPGEDVRALDWGQAQVTNDGTWRIVRPFHGEADGPSVMQALDGLFYGEIIDSISRDGLRRLGRDLSDLGLEPPEMRLQVTEMDGSEELRFGAVTPDGRGRYAMVSGENMVMVIPTNVYASIDLPIDVLRRRELFRLLPSEIKGVSVRLNAGSTYRFDRGLKTNAKLESYLKELLAAKAIDFVWPRGGTNETTVADASLLASYGLVPESAVTVTFQTFNGHDRVVSFGRSAGIGKVYALAFDGTSVVTVDRRLKDIVLGGEEAFIDTRLYPLEAADVRSITLADGDMNCLLAVDAGGDWRLDAPISAPASKTVVSEILKRILSMHTMDLDERGVQVSLGTGTAEVGTQVVSCRVARSAVLGRRRLADLRSLDMMKLDDGGVKRLVGAQSVVYDGERRQWMAEGAGRVDEDAVKRLLAMLNPLRARHVITLKAFDADLARYGLDHPTFKIAVDFVSAGTARRNVLIGARTKDGWYATLGGNDAVFVLSDETVNALKADLVE